MSDTPNARPGAAASPEDPGDALPAGTRLAEFEIRQVLGIGGFGIVYRAWDAALQRDVALKEYLPVSMAGRGAGERVTLRSRGHEDDFALGLQSFVNEARLLARFDQPALVKVLRFWEANGTAYMAMPLYRGRTLRQLRKDPAGVAFDDAWARALVEPLLDALAVMHDAGVCHRDIAPDNILWCDDGRPVLLDFGAARHVLADRTQNVTAILKPQFAPIEQYAQTVSMRQGPWTDLYALASTCYFMLTGRAPLPATARVMSDELAPLARLAPPGCSARLLQALDWAMAVRPQDRPQSVARWRDALAGRIAVPVRAATAAAAAPVAPDPSAYEKTIQATRRTPPAQDAGPAPAPLPPPEAGLGRPERTVMPPPASRSPFKPLLLLALTVAAAGAAWTTRPQWMPALGLQAAAAPPAASVPAAEVPGDAAGPAPGPVAEAASEAPPAASEVAPGPAAAATASQAAAPAASPPASAAAPAPAPSGPASAAPAPPARTAHAKPPGHGHAKPARLPAFTLPPPALPPANESHVVGAVPARAPAEAVEPAPIAAAPVPSAPRGPGPREVCAETEPAHVNACVQRLCDNDARYQRYPACRRLRRQE